MNYYINGKDSSGDGNKAIMTNINYSNAVLIIIFVLIMMTLISITMIEKVLTVVIRTIVMIKII